MDTKSTQYDVIISGGGMVGMTLALLLARGGVRAALIERGAMPAQLEPQFDGRVSAISRGSSYVLDDAGAWEAMRPYAEPIFDIRVSDGAMPFFLHYDHREVGDEAFGYIVENRYIRTALHAAALVLPNLTLLDNTQITRVERDSSGVDVHLNNGQELRCRLLVGADGRNSQVREIAGIGVTQWNYHQTAIVCTIAHELPHQGLAQERFLPAGPFAVLPMGENRSSLVWVEPDDRVALYMELPEEEFVQEITERVGNYLGTIRTVGKRFTYPLSLLHAKSYVGDRIALVGDAAHAIHPIAGQGVNLGFRDVKELSELVIARFKLGQDIGDNETLERYARLRRFDNITMIAATDLLNRLFGVNWLPVQLARDVGMWAVGKLPPLKRMLMRHAMGMGAIH